MAVKSVVDIEINDASFKRFQASWAAFRKTLTGGPFSEFEKGQLRILRARDAAREKEKKEHKEFIALLKEEALHYTRHVRLIGQMATSARDFSNYLKGGLITLSRVTGVGTAIAGILGAGSLWGLDRLAGSVGAGRRGAQGLGTSYGQARAFNLNFERLIDAPGFLSGVAGALASPSGAVPFGALGLDQGAMQKKGAADAGVEVLKKLMHIADTQPETLWTSILSAGQLDRFNVSTEDLRRLRATSPEERKGIFGSYGKDVRSLGVSDKAARALQDFSVQLDRVGRTLESTFGERLSKLAPGLTALSDSVVKALSTFLDNSPAINTGLEKFGHSIEWLAGYVGSDDFQTKIKSFVTGIGELADSTVKVLRFLGVVSGPKTGEINGSNSSAFLDNMERRTLDRMDRAAGGGGTGASFADRFSAGATGTAATGLNADLGSRLQQLRDAAQRDIGEAGRITSGYRSREEQAALYANRGGNPYPVARPGFSQHERGMAADVAGSSRFMDYVHSHAAEYGLNFPHANDPVHVQLSNPRVDIRIDNPAGANVFSSTNAVGQAP